MPSSTEAANFQDVIAQLAAVAVARTVDLLQSTQDVMVLQDAYPLVVDPVIAASAQVSAEWYRSLDPEAQFAVEPVAPPPVSALQTNVRWAVTQLDVVGALSGSAERQVFTASRETVASNADRERVRFARYASANACPWCRVLATRGAVYRAADLAVKGHDNCHCIAVPERGGNTYQAPDYVAGWLEDYNAARKEVGGNLNDIVNYLRRT